MPLYARPIVSGTSTAVDQLHKYKCSSHSVDITLNKCRIVNVREFTKYSICSSSSVVCYTAGFFFLLAGFFFLLEVPFDFLLD